MKRSLTSLSVICSLLFVNLNTSAQDIKWSTAPKKGNVFEISNKEAQKLLTRYQANEKYERMLHTLIDSFDIAEGWIDRPPKGHFILAKIAQNKLRCEYTSVFPYQVFLFKEYDALALQVVDLDGNVREDAKVKLGWQRIRIDKESKTYRIENTWVRRRFQRATVEMEGFRSVFKIEKHDVPTWYPGYYDKSGPAFFSYMITDKNKYKPGEQVRLKSYALSNSRTPLRKDLEIWLTDYRKRYKIGYIEPHRPGSYAGEFHLHDSLNLALDKNYNLQLKEKRGRIVADCQFRYEDYELFGNHLEIKLTNTSHFHPNTNQLSITATDINGLMLKDARAEVLIKTKSIMKSYQPVVILSDTLLFSKIELNPDEPTVFDIPSDLFKETNTSYKVVVTVLNSENEPMVSSIDAKHYFSQYDLKSRFSNDSICFDLLKNGVPIENVNMNLWYDDDQDSITIIMPYKEKLNPAVKIFHFKNEHISENITLKYLSPAMKLIGGIQQDSFKIHLHNPQHLDVSWYIYQGSILLEKGFGDTLEHKSLIVNRSLTYYIELFYSLGGQEHKLGNQYAFREDFLDISLDIPDRVYPGQEIEATITVKDQIGNPVKGVDLTALAVTGTLNYHLPDLPYYGPKSTPRTKREHYTKFDLDIYSKTLPLDYKRWMKQARLDTMIYYQFTYPKNHIFKYTYDIDDSTQFAIYAMREGIAQKIYVIEVDKRPVYYSWTERPREYSFYVSPDEAHEVSLRLHDTVLVLYPLHFEAGKKTILSIDLDHLPFGIEAHELVPEFTNIERNRHRNYLARFLNMYSKYAYLESNNDFIALFGDQKNVRSYKASVLAGPVKPGSLNYTQGENITTRYRHDGGFRYKITGNIVYKQDDKKLLPDFLKDISYNPMLNINDLAMNKKRFLSLYQKNQLNDFRWQPGTIHVVEPGSNIRIILPEEDRDSGISALLFEDCLTKHTLAPCYSNPYSSSTEFDSLPAGFNNVVVLYNNGNYLKMDSICLEPYSHVVIDMNYSKANPVDSVSEIWQLRHRWASSKCYESPSVEEIRPAESTPYILQNLSGNLSGVVLDVNNEPLPGANIIIRGTSTGTISDLDGRFSLQIDQDNTPITISFVGFMEEEIYVSRGSEVRVTLVEDIMNLSEIVVVGYGVCHKKDLTGAVSSLSGRAAGISADIVEEALPVSDEEAIREAEQKLYRELLTLNSIRSNFSDVGFWEPRLYTDRKGISRFNITFPDDITRWDAVVYAMNKRLQTGTERKFIRSYKPLMAELHVPRFLTDGDSANFTGKVLNFTSDSIIRGQIEWSGTNTAFKKEIEFSGYHNDKLPVIVSGTDSITSRYVFTREDGYLDGEERSIPVIKQGIVRVDGKLNLLENGDSRYVKASENETVTVKILKSQVQVYGQDIRYLLNYRFACNEQLASKLIGLINHKLLMEYEEKSFNYDKDVNKIIKRLLKNQNKEFLWSWWDVSPNTSYWMSAHILRALKCAKDAGYTVNLNVNNIARKASYKFEMLNEISYRDIDLLHAIAEWEAEFDYEKYINVLDSLLVKREFGDTGVFRNYHSRYSYLREKFLLQEMRQIRNLQYERDTLMKYIKEGILGEIFFSDEKVDRYWYNDKLATNVIAYRIVKRDSVLNQMTVPMQMYFISKRNKGEWNTYRSSTVLLNVLPDLLKQGFSRKNSSIVRLNGKENKTISKFPHEIELESGEELQLYKESGLPVYYMQYTKERVTEAKTGVKGFKISSFLSNKNMKMKAGVPVDLVVEVEVEKDASQEHVMIEVPIPGSCSYAEKQQMYYGVETHREYFKEQTVIFCERMKPGKYSFVIHLLPRFTGKYILNPAQVSLMYIPVVNANTSMKQVEIKEME